MVVAFVELDPSVYTFTPSNVGWQPYDVTTIWGIPKGAILHVQILNSRSNASRTVGVRTDGSVLERLITVHESEPNGTNGIVMDVKVDASTGLIEIYCDVTSNVIFNILSYFTGVDYTESFQAIEPTPQAGWRDIALSGYGVPADATCQISMEQGNLGWYCDMGVRANGSSLSRLIRVHEAEPSGNVCYSNYVKADATSIIEGYIQYLATPRDRFMHLLGWYGPEIDYQELWSLKNISLDATWEEFDLTAELDQDGRVVTLCIFNTGTEASNTIGARGGASEVNRFYVEHEAETYGISGDCFIAQSDSDGIIDLYASVSVAETTYLAGYFITVELPPPTFPDDWKYSTCRKLNYSGSLADYRKRIRVYYTPDPGNIKDQIASLGYTDCSQRPQAIYDATSGLYIYVFFEREELYIKIVAYRASTGEYSADYTIASVANSAEHRSPAVGILPSGKLIVFYNYGTLYYKISTYTLEQIADSLTALQYWGSETQYGSNTDVYYPGVHSFSDKIVLTYSRQTVQWSNVTHWYDTFNGSSWSGAVQIANHIDDGSYLFYTKVGNNILGCGYNRLTANGGYGDDIYFLYSPDKGVTWKKADGTTLTLPVTKEHLILDSSGKIRCFSTIVDENGKPIIIYQRDSNEDTVFEQYLLQYSAVLGSSGSWSADYITENSNYVQARANDFCDLFLGNEESRPAFWLCVIDGANNYIKRFVRNATSTYAFTITDEDTSASMTNFVRSASIWNKLTNKPFEVLMSEIKSGEAYKPYVRYGLLSETAGVIFTDGQCKTDFGDIRFCEDDDSTLLDYWMYNKVDGSFADFMVEVVDIPCSIHIWWGCEGVESLSDISAIGLIFYEPFDSTTLDTGRWPTVDGNPTYSIDAVAHILSITDMDGTNWETGKGFHSKILSLPAGWIIEDAYGNPDGFLQHESTTAATDYNHGTFSIHHTGWSSDDFGIGFTRVLDAWSTQQWGITVGVGGNEDYTDYPHAGAEKTTRFVIYKVGGTIVIKEKGVQRHSESNSETPDRVHLGIGRFSTNVFGTIKFGAFIIRNYVDPEPTWAFCVGIEETITAKNFPMLYLSKPVTAKELASKIEGATITTVSKDFPKILIRKGKAAELQSKWE